jgi:endonuclease-3
MNTKIQSKINKILNLMLSESKKRDAPVYKIHSITMGDPFRSLVFTILSARTRDETTIRIAVQLLNAAPTPYRLAGMHEQDIEKLVYGVGFYRTKAKNLRKMAKILVLRYDGMVPETTKKLIALPGVGRKTANVILASVFNKDAIGVDTHVHRISNRLGLVRTKKPKETEKALMKTIPKKHWKKLNITMVAHGQTVCIPRNPKCPECPIRRYCPRVGVLSNLLLL